METATITIQQKKPYSGNAETHPEGDFYANGEKYTCWDPILFATFKEGDTVLLEYTEKSNDYNGRTYINRNISKMSYAPNNAPVQGVPALPAVTAQIPQQIPEQTIVPEQISNNIIQPAAEMPAGMIRVGNQTYEVILRLVNE